MGQRGGLERRKSVLEFSPAGTLSSRALEEGKVSVHRVYSSSQTEPADACENPISPWVRKQCEPPEEKKKLMGVEDQEEEEEVEH